MNKTVSQQAPEAQQTASLFACTDYRTLMGALETRKRELGLTNLELDERGGLPSGYAGKLLCGSRRMGLETVGRMLAALDAVILVVPADNALTYPQLPIKPIAIKPLDEEIKKIQREWGRKGGRKYALLTSPRKRKAIACMGGRASAEARRLRKLGLAPVVTKANPAILRKLAREPKQTREL